MILDLASDGVDVALRSWSKSAEIHGKFNLLESIEVGFNGDVFDVQFLTEKVVVRFEVWSCHNPSFGTRKTLTTLGIDSNSTSSFCEFTNEFHLVFKSSIMRRKLCSCSGEVFIPCISRSTFGRTGCTKWPCCRVNGFSSKVSMDGIDHEWTHRCNQSAQGDENLVQGVLTCKFVTRFCLIPQASSASANVPI